MSESRPDDGRDSGSAKGPGPRSHVPHDVLGAYVVGDCSPGAALAIACHLTLCGHCRARARLLEDLGGVSLEVEPPAPLPEAAWEATLARLTQPDDFSDSAAAPVEEIAGGESLSAYRLPRPLLRALRDSAPRAAWRWLAPGVRFIDLAGRAASDGGHPTARLVKLRPGLEIPLHDHQGDEYTLIFTGALEDAGACFTRGDLVCRTPGQRHVQRVARGEACIALQVNEGPLTPLTWKGRLLSLVVAGR